MHIAQNTWASPLCTQNTDDIFYSWPEKEQRVKSPHSHKNDKGKPFQFQVELSVPVVGFFFQPEDFF